MNNDQIKGDINRAKGTVKETVGKVFGDKSMENKGKVQNAYGNAQKTYGDVKEDVKDGLKGK